jgi:hypothetical protein
MLLPALLEIFAAWRPAFTQGRSHRRAVAQALGTLVSFGRRTLSRALWALGHQQQDWSARIQTVFPRRLETRTPLSARDRKGPALMFRPLYRRRHRRHPAS